jgi:6-phosphogluconolactonase
MTAPAPRGLRDVVVDAPDSLAEALAMRLRDEVEGALAERGVATVALTGGSFAPAFYPRLAGLTLDWSRLRFFWGDERAVPPEHEDSNYLLARELWLEPAGVPEASVHRMLGEATDLDAAVASYAHVLAAEAGDPPRLDVVLLGVGDDGHVASLFPGHPLLRESERTVAAVFDAPKPPQPRRLTLTLPVLTRARLVVVGALGAKKAAPIAEALADPASSLPLALVLRGAKRALVLLDPEAASQLDGEPASTS